MNNEVITTYNTLIVKNPAKDILTTLFGIILTRLTNTGIK